MFTLYNIIKVLISAILIMIISVVSKKSSFLGAVFASVPLVSVLAIIWMHVDGSKSKEIIDLSYSVFWLVIPSLSFFIALPLFLKRGFSFYPSIIFSLSVMVVLYFLMVKVLSRFNISI